MVSDVFIHMYMYIPHAHVVWYSTNYMTKANLILFHLNVVIEASL